MGGPRWRTLGTRRTCARLSSAARSWCSSSSCRRRRTSAPWRPCSRCTRARPTASPLRLGGFQLRHRLGCNCPAAKVGNHCSGTLEKFEQNAVDGLGFHHPPQASHPAFWLLRDEARWHKGRAFFVITEKQCIGPSHASTGLKLQAKN